MFSVFLGAWTWALGAPAFMPADWIFQRVGSPEFVPAISGSAELEAEWDIVLGVKDMADEE